MAALPRQLKNYNLFHNGYSFLGQIKSLTRPKLARKMESYRGGGMDRGVKIDMGGEDLEMSWNAGGVMEEVRRQYGAASHDALELRYAGAFEREDGTTDAVEIYVRGRHEEIEAGEDEPGKASEEKVKTALSYYREVINGVDVIEIDVLGFVFIVDGVDRLQAQRDILGA